MNNGILVQDLLDKPSSDIGLPRNSLFNNTIIPLPYSYGGDEYWKYDPNKFVLLYDTRYSNNTNITLPLSSGPAYNIVVDWGDGVVSRYSGTTQNVSYTYSSHGIYLVQISNSMTAWGSNIINTNANKLVKCLSFGSFPLTALYYALDACSNLIEVPKNIRSGVSQFQFCFRGCLKFDQDLSLWDTSSATSFANMFQNSTSFNNRGSDQINNWNTGNVTNTSFMFNGARAFNQPLNNWDTRKVINFNSMFQGATSFNSSLSGWELGLDTAATTCGNMFQGATNFNQDIGNWDTSKVTNMGNMFISATNFNQDIGGWNVSNVTSFAFMFWAFPVVLSFNFNLGSWDVSKATTLQEMFRGCISVSNQDLRNWNLARINVSNGLDNFMLGATGANSMTTANYDALLIGWNNNKLASANGIANWRTDLRPHFGGAKYTAGGAAAAARAALVSYGWTITDGGVA